MINTFFCPTIIGQIGIAENGSAITHLYLPGDTIPPEANIVQTDLLSEAAGQLEAYFSGNLKEFDLPLAPSGTPFMLKVWKSLVEIPYAETRSYSEIAAAVGNPRACRAVGQANNRNPIPIIIPCHRVIGANGKLIGYGGGLHAKAYLLNLERNCLSQE